MTTEHPRDEQTVAAALRRLTAAAYTAVASHATPDEVLAAYEAGVADALDARDVRRHAAETVRRITEQLGGHGDQAAAA